MPKVKKTTTLYPTPFSKQYWHDAAAELKDTKMLVIAALMIALRVALKGLYIPIAPNLNINIGAPFINALGAMIFGPVMAGLAACVSDTLGCLLFPQGPYFFPCMFVEVAGSMVFAMFFYRAKMTTSRVILARFSMNLFVNIILNSAVMCWYYQVLLGKSYVAMIIPAAIKNLCMFPIEAFLLTLFLSIMVPITYRMGLTYDGEADKNSLKFSKRHAVTLVALFVISASILFGYLFYYYDHNSVSGSYTKEERYSANCQMNEIILDQTDDWDEGVTAGIVESAYRKFGKGYTTYNVALYTVDEAALEASGDSLETVRGLSKSPASKHDALTKAATAVIEVNNKTGEVLSFTCTPVE